MKRALIVAVTARATFVSPTRNIQCVYVNQWGISCRTGNNGRVAILHAWTGVVSFQGYARYSWYGRYSWNGPYSWYGRYSWYTRVIPYGRTVAYGGTFRVHSDGSGIDVWSTLTHRGFHIDRDSMGRL